jgi:hypothetical protein
MSNLTDFFPSGGGGGLTPKFEEFNSSGTFTPSQALIDAGGYIELFLVGGGSYGNFGQGGEALMTRMYLNSTSAITVTIGAGGQSYNTNGSDSSFNGAAAGGSNVTALRGLYKASSGENIINGRISPGWSGGSGSSTSSSAGNGVFGYGAGGGGMASVGQAKANSGQGGGGAAAGSGYCLIKWYE